MFGNDGVSSCDSLGAAGDPRRLVALRATELLDSPPEEAFDRLTRLASRVLGVPIAIVSLVDADRQFFKSCVGLPDPLSVTRQTPLSHSFCRHAVESGQPLIIEDARVHPLVRDNPATIGMGVVAYAGIPLITPDGHALGSFCAIDGKPRNWTERDIDILRDLAASVMSEIALRIARDHAQAANRSKDRFLAMLSHELRTPVSPALLIATSMAGDTSLPDAVREDASTIQRNIEQQTRLIDDLLDVTRIENGKLVLLRQPVDLHEVIAESIALCADEASGRGLIVRCQPIARQHHLTGDAGRLRQLFANLLRNAIKFTPSPGRINLSTIDFADRRVCVEVRDTGIGVAPEVIHKLFNPFEQGERAITNQFSGLGLGLAICKGVAEAHGGSITVTSAGRGRGTSFQVILPAFEMLAADVGASEPDAPEPAQVRQLSILLVDDHQDTLRAMSRLLGKLRHKVVSAESKSAALVAAATQPFDLLISDIGLPDGTGLELMRELSRQRAIKGIALTGYGTEGDIERTRSAGFQSHLTKPIDFKQLELIIQQVSQ